MTTILKNKAADEYEIQFFGFSRNFLKCCLKCLVEDQFNPYFAVAEKIISSYDFSEKSRHDLMRKCSFLLKFCLNKSLINLDQIYSELDKYFSIPGVISLPEDEHYNECVDQSDIERLKKELEDYKLMTLSLDAAEAIMEKELLQAEQVRKNLFLEEPKLASYLEEMKNVF